MLHDQKSDDETKEKLDYLNIKHSFEFMDFPFQREKEWDFKWKFEPDTEYKISKLYEKIVTDNNLDYYFLSGWLKYVIWLEENKTVNIHPWPMESQWYWWKDMHWMNVHNKVWQDYIDWKINQTCMTMHYVTDEFDKGPIITQIPVSLVWCQSPDDVQKAVNKMEHEFQWIITQMVISWDISWSWDYDDKVVIKEGALDKYTFPEWTVFAWKVDLEEWIPYNN